MMTAHEQGTRDFAQQAIRIERTARWRLRGIACDYCRDDLLQEIRATVWRAFVRLRERGIDGTKFATAVVHFAATHALRGRRFAGASRLVNQDQERDHRHECYEDVEESHAYFGNEATPAELAAFRIDYRDWLAQLSERNRELAELLAAGGSGRDAACFLKIHDTRVSQLRRELAYNWQDFTSDGGGR